MKWCSSQGTCKMWPEYALTTTTSYHRELCNIQRYWCYRDCTCHRRCEKYVQSLKTRPWFVFSGFLQELFWVHSDTSAALPDPWDDKFDGGNIQHRADADLWETASNHGNVLFKELLCSHMCRIIPLSTEVYCPLFYSTFQLVPCYCRISLLGLIHFLLFPYLYSLFLQGNVDITDHKIVPADAQLASDYQSVSSENPPAKKAKDMHAVSNCLAFLITPIK